MNFIVQSSAKIFTHRPFICSNAPITVIRNWSSEADKPEIPKNTLEPFITAHKQPTNGVIYDKRPFKIFLEAGKKYSWCLCGRSKTQPFCDVTHKNIFFKIKQRPVWFKVEKSKDYWLCNCKQTKNRPFCDGTHKDPEIQTSDVKVNF